MRTVISGLFFAVLGSNAAYAQQSDTLTKGDFNKDGYKDYILQRCANGSGFGGCTFQFKNGKDKRIVKVPYTRCYCSLLGLLPYPQALFKDSRFRNFPAGFEKAFLAGMPLQAADASLHWLIDANYTYRLLPGDSLFSSTLHWMPRWQSGTPAVPANYAVRLSGDTLNVLSRRLLFDEGGTRIDSGSSGLLLFYAQRQLGFNAKQSLSPVVRNAEQHTNVYTTGSAVIFQKDSLYTWCFFNDALFEGPPKQGAATIRDVAVFNDLVFVLVNSGGGVAPQLFVCDPVKGCLAEFSKTPDAEKIGLENGVIRCGNGCVYLTSEVLEHFKSLGGK